MNCKPGDLAITVGSVSGKQDGRLVEVLRAANPKDVKEWEPAAWFVKVLGSPLHMVAASGESAPFSYCAIRDCNLRPIRDPGDDATDETLTWLPVPSCERETA